MLIRAWSALAVLAVVLCTASTAHALPASTGRWDAGNGIGYPLALHVLPDGSRVHVLTYQAPQVRVLSPAGTSMGSWGTMGTGNGQFQEPSAISAADTGTVYVADRNLDRIQYFTPAGIYQGQWGTSGTGEGQFTDPIAMDVAQDATVYVLDRDERRVQRFSSTGTFLGAFAANGDDPPADTSPTGIAIDGSGDVFVSDEFGKVRRFSATGTLEATWGARGIGPGQLQRPWNITVPPGGTGTVYVTEQFLQQEGSELRAQAFTPDGGYLGAFVTEGTGQGQVENLSGISVDCAGKLYVGGYGEVELFSDSVTSGCGILVNDAGDDADTDLADKQCDTVAGTPGQQCTLRAALQEAAKQAGRQDIRFAISGVRAPIIAPASALPALKGPDQVRGETQRPAARVALRGPGAVGLRVEGNARVSGMAIGGFTEGIRLTGAGGSVLTGNYIGVDPDGVTARPNGLGVLETGSGGHHRIGGLAPGEGNLISGNTQHGLRLSAEATEVLGNIVGLRAAADLALPNGGAGIMFQGVTLGRIAHNNVGGGGASGIELFKVAGVIVEDNLIGGDKDLTNGSLILGNQNFGIYAHFETQQAGGATSLIRSNIVVNNKQGGIHMARVAGWRVEGNAVGTDPTGTSSVPLGNALGIRIDDATNIVVGSAAAPNRFSGNRENGVQFSGSQTSAVEVLHNEINRNGVGVDIGQSVSGVRVASNTIASNGVAGILDLADHGTVNQFLGNAITDSADLAIDLMPVLAYGVNPNDDGDLDAGPNGLQNFPVLAAAPLDGTRATVAGTLGTKPGTYRVELFGNVACDSSGHGELERPLDEFDLVVDTGGVAGFARELEIPAGVTQLAATATGLEGTSEAGPCLAVGTSGAPVQPPLTPGGGTPGTLPPPPPPVPPVPAAPRVNGTPRVVGRALEVRLRCPGPRICAGVAAVETATKLPRAAKVTKIGSKRYRVGAEKRLRLKIKLSSRARKVLRRRSLKVRLVLTPAGGNRTVRKLTLPRRRGS